MRPLNISTDQAKNYYYKHDPFFTAKDNSNWHGKSADMLELSGKVSEDNFLNILKGNDKNGTQLVQESRANKTHRAAIDIPFSAPKSVSIMALHGGDNKLIDAHHKAVKSTVEYIEKNYIYARKTTNGITQKELTGNGLFATFTHSTSRTNDPHLHTHSLSINMTKNDRGWRAIWNDKIFSDQTLLNNIYQSELAKNVKELGYGVKTKKNGFWEIEGVKKKWIENFSKRQSEIDKEQDKLIDGDLDDKKISEIRDEAQKRSRDEKSLDITKDELLEMWDKEVSRDKILNNVNKYFGKDTEAKEVISANDLINISCNAIHDSESLFEKKDVLDLGLKMSRGIYSIIDMDDAFDKLFQTGNIIHISDTKNQKSYYTTLEMAKIEESIVKNFQKGKGTFEPVSSHEIVESFLQSDHAYFTNSQKNMIGHILNSTDQFSIIQGDAGTGKTTALKALKEFLERDYKDYNLLGLSFTGKAVNELSEKAGIKSMTLHSYLNKKNKGTDNRKQIWIVDESSMVGSKQMNKLIKAAKQKSAKVFFIGDGKQFQAISAGRMFKDLQKIGTRIVEMKDVLRQKNEYMKNVVNEIVKYQETEKVGCIKQVFSLLKKEGNVQTKQDMDLLFDQVKDEYNKSPNETLVVTPNNENRIELNSVIRDSLKEKDLIDSEDFQFNIRTPVAHIGVSKYISSSYKIGETGFINMSEEYQKNFNFNFKPGTEFTITHVDKKNNLIKIKTENGVSTIDMKRHGNRLSMYEESQRDFSKNDTLVCMKNDKKLGLQNGLKVKIDQLDKNGNMTFKIDEKRKVKFNISDYAYCDYGYAVTTYKSQGQDSKHVIYVSDTKNKKLNTTESLYVGASRAEESFKIFTDNGKKLMTQFMEGQNKTSTLDKVLNDLKKNTAKNKINDKGISL